MILKLRWNSSVLGILKVSGVIIIVVAVHEGVVNRQERLPVLTLGVRAILVAELVSVDAHSEHFI